MIALKKIRMQDLPEATYLAQVWPLIGVLEPDMFFQGCSFHACVVATLALELHVLFRRMLPQYMRL